MSKYTISNDQTLAKKLLDKFGGEVDDYFKLWPKDKKYFYSSNKNAFIAFTIKYKIAICLFDPIGNKESINLVLNEFSIYSKQQRLSTIFIQATDKYKVTYESLNLRSLVIGADGLVEIKKFLNITIHNKYFRNIVNRFSKNGYEVEVSYPPHNKSLINKLHDVSNDWIKLPHHKEWKFLAGSFSVEYLSKVPIYYLSENKEKIWAFANALPIYRKGVATVDLIRRRRDSPTNSIDFLYIGIISLLGENKIKYFNIGISPIDGANYAKNNSEKFLILFYKTSQTIIGFKGLHHFKVKYEPKWEPRYVYRQKGILKLFKSAIAVYRVMM